jgi:hypothetical protein
MHDSGNDVALVTVTGKRKKACLGAGKVVVVPIVQGGVRSARSVRSRRTRSPWPTGEKKIKGPCGDV